MREIQYLLETEALQEERVLNRRHCRIEMSPLGQSVQQLSFMNMRVCFCRRLSQKHIYYEEITLHHSGYVSKTGNGAIVVVIPNNKTGKERKFDH